MSIKEPVRLREKTISDGSRSLYLDIYYEGKRTYEFLKLYLMPGKSPAIREHNKETLLLANKIKAKRTLEVQDAAHGFSNRQKLEANFLDYFKQLAEDRKQSKGNYDNWLSSYNYLKKFSQEDLRFKNIDEDFVRRFRDFLLKEKITKYNSQLAQNSALSYFNKFKAALNQAFEDRVIVENPAKRVKGIKQAESKREFLTLEELRTLWNTECVDNILKRAFLFSCLTGLRWSDIVKLKWSDIQKTANQGYFIRFKQKKTSGEETLPINNEAQSLLDSDGEGKVFKGLRYSAWHNLKLARWIIAAGIIKNITFHCARHTYATLQLTYGTDIYTLSKMLGHSTVKTTQVYAKIVDQKKVDAANRIPSLKPKDR